MKKTVSLLLALLFILSLTACSGQEEKKTDKEQASTKKQETEDRKSEEKPEVIRVGLVGENNEVWDDVAIRFEEGEGIKLELIKFTDYNQPNEALAAGDLDLNAFQHKIFLENFNQETGSNLVPIGDTLLAPIGLYSRKIKSIDEVKEGDKIAIPDDVTNYARSLFLLQTAGLIEVEGEPGEAITMENITANPLKLEIIPMNSNQTARSLEDVTLSAINSGMAVDAGFYPNQDAIFLEPIDDHSLPYMNIIAAREEDKENFYYLKLVKDYFQQPESAAVIDKASKGSQIPAWEGFDQDGK